MIRKLAVLCVFAAVGRGYGAIKLDAVASETAVSTNTINIPVTVSSNSDRFLGVGCAYYTSSANQSASTVRLNGVDLKFLRRDKDPSFAATTEYWYLVAPASGAGTVTVTFSAALPAGGAGCVAKEFSGVNQTTPIDTSAHSFVSGTNGQNPGTITTGVPGAFVDDVLVAGSSASPGS